MVRLADSVEWIRGVFGEKKKGALGSHTLMPLALAGLPHLD
jgi:hypothetical protein